MKYKSVPLCLLNAHLESTAEGAQERKNQLRLAFRNILNAPNSNTVIFGGDVNLRDKEVSYSSHIFIFKCFYNF